MIPRRSSLLPRALETLERLARARALSSSSYSSPATPEPPPPTPIINHASSAVDFETEVLVIGAGVVGLAVARAFAKRGASVVLVERRAAIGTETSSRSSEVIHAGLYYPPGSLKATLCARGRDMLYVYCAERGVAHRRIGKLVVATTPAGGGGQNDDDDRRLDALAANADAACARAGAAPLGMRLLTGAQARALEPSLGPKVSRALLSPRTGIVDSHGLMACLLADAEAGGATTLALRSAAVPMPKAGAGGGVGGSGRPLLTVAVRDVGGGGGEAGGGGGGGGGGETAVFGARRVINCAGLGAEECSRGALAHLGAGVAATAPRVRYAKGNYFELAGGIACGGGSGDSSGSSATATTTTASTTAAPPPFFSRLIYPLPEDGGLGIHLTLDLAGRARFGPDVEWLPPPASAAAAQGGGGAPPPAPPAPPEEEGPPAPDYRVSPSRASDAGWPAAIRAYWPGLPDCTEALVPAYSGVRPKLSGPGERAEDFGVQTARGATWRGGRGHGVEGLVCLFGVESPGLTSAMALAEHVVAEAGM